MSSRKCKICQVVFDKDRPLQFICSVKCAIEYNAKKSQKAWKFRKKEMKASLKTPNDFRKDLENEVNHIVRLIDSGLGCIGCGNSKRMAAGHFHAVGSNHSLRFHLDNIHRQDFHCNGNGGQVLKYGLGLIKEYGKNYKDYIEYDLVKQFPEIKLSIPELKDKIKIARSIVKHLELENKEYTANERRGLRNQFNLMLGIYKYEMEVKPDIQIS